MPEALDMAAVAIAALNREEGVSRFFVNGDFPSPEACKKAVIALRNRFYTMKAKERRQQRRKYGSEETLYDNLSCLIDETPNGWCLRICAASTDIGVFVDTKTGVPLSQRPSETSEQKWLRSIRNQATDCMQKGGNLPCPFPEETVDRLWTEFPDVARAIYEDLGWDKPISDHRLTTMEDMFPQQQTGS